MKTVSNLIGWTIAALVLIGLVSLAAAVVRGAEPTIEAPAQLAVDQPGMVRLSPATVPTHWPKTGVTFGPLLVGGKPVVWPEGANVGRWYVFSASAPGSYLVQANVVQGDGISAWVAATIVVGDSPDPEPDPDPKPDPDPEPGPRTLRVLVVEEKQSDRPFFVVLHSPEVTKWLEDNGHTIRRRDQHDVDDDGNRVCPEGGPVPCVYLYDADSGELLWSGLPKDEKGEVTEAAFLEVVRKWGKRK